MTLFKVVKVNQWQARIPKSIFKLFSPCRDARISFKKSGGKMYTYILNQEQHHAKQTFKDEYMDLLKKFEIEHDVKYLFDWMEA